MSAQVIAGPWIEAPSAIAPKRLFRVTVKLSTTGSFVDFETRCATSFDAYDAALNRFPHTADRIEVEAIEEGGSHAAA